ncbi:MAG TPA: thioredoxin family protein [Elusimicrobiota bacterium]|jgi:thiol:disulfide interchange protein DsbD|nr:thioredoxin family protein [Elusimicrobiota bacterium]
MRIALAFALLALAGPARAGNVAASLLSSRDAARPGESFDAGLRLKLKPGWHVYWKNPGDSGLAPKLAWKLPPGWGASAFDWPAPRRLEAPPLTSFGYEGEVVFPLSLSVPAGARPGTKAMLSAKAEWLECRDVCIPGSAALTLPVAVANASRERQDDAAALSAARAEVPRPDDGAAAGASWNGASAILRLSGRHPLAEFFPSAPGVFDNGPTPVSESPSETELTLLPAAGMGAPARVEGVLLRRGEPPVSISLPVSAGGAAARFILLAFVGGLLLNLMPCVFPVLAFKALGLLGRLGQHPRAARLEALAYSAGMTLSCLTLAVVLLAARRAGGALGWGFQLQSPWVVGALAALFFLAGAGLLGYFEFGARWMGLGEKLSARHGLAGAFFSGVFAMAAAAPCTAPFMGAALGWAVTRPAGEALAVFGALGLGASTPYALLSSWPALIRRLPHPGRWMETLKRVLSLPMFATCAWLLWVLWRMLAAPAPATNALWHAWSPEAVEAARAQGKTAVLDFTAAWCLSCQVNERTTLSTPAVVAALSRPDVAAFRGDWTNRDARITAVLMRYGRDGVPLYVVYPKGGSVVLLPELLTPGLVLDALKPSPEAATSASGGSKS